MHPSNACPHGVVIGQCMFCLADHLAAEALLLERLRAWHPRRQTTKEEDDAVCDPTMTDPADPHA